MAPLRWGIAGCGHISSDFSNALQYLGGDNVIVACADRSPEDALKFSKKFGVGKVYSHEEMAEDPDIDIIYIGVVIVAHLPLSKIYLTAGKPVICEKPLGQSYEETKEIVDLAREKNVFMMMGLWARCNPVYRELKKRLENKEIGDVTHVHVDYGLIIEDMPRIARRDLGGGVTPEIGIYASNLILMAMNEDMPEDIQTHGRFNEHGCEMEVSGIMKFSGNRFANFTLSASTLLPNEATITGTKGTIRLGSPFWGSTHLSGPSGEFSNKPDPADKREYNYENSHILKYEVEEVARCIREGRKESSLVPHKLIMNLATIIRRIRLDVGVKF